MSWFLFPLLAVLLLFCLGLMPIPCLCLYDRRLAKLRKRSLFDKSAWQLAPFGALLLSLLGLALAADYWASGRIYQFCMGFGIGQSLFFLTLGTVVFSALMLWLAAAKYTAALWAALVSSLFSLFSVITIFWIGLRGFPVSETVQITQYTDFFYLLADFYESIWLSDFFALFALFVLTCFFLAFFCACLFSLVWYIIRRFRDDFGRDYYTVMMLSRARQAIFWGILALPSFAALFWLTPAPSAEHLLMLVPGTLAAQGMNPQILFHALSAGSFAFPLSIFCCYFLGRAAIPMQKKYLVFLALLLLFFGSFCLLARIWG